MWPFLYFILYLILFLITFFLLRKYDAGFSFKYKKFAGLMLYRELFILIGISSIILTSYPIDVFFGFNNTRQETVVYITFYVWLALFIYVLVFALFNKIIYNKFCISKGGDDLNSNLFLFSLGIATFMFLLLVLFYGVKHAFLYALIFDSNLLTTRLDNKYLSNAPTFINTIIIYLTFFSIILFCFIKKKTKKFNLFSIFLIFILLSYGGGKDLIIRGGILLLLCSLAAYPGAMKINFRIITLIFSSVLLIFLSIFLIVKVQFPDYTGSDLFFYFVNRIGVGQISGVYEQFNLRLYNEEYIYHSIPFFNVFFDYPIFQKDLMVYSEGVLDPTRTGIKNSLFISEASSFGIFFLIVSPVVVGMNSAIAIGIISIFLSKFYINNRVLSFKISTFLFFTINPITGGFSEFLFFKSTILVLLILSFLIFTTKFFELLIKRLR